MSIQPSRQPPPPPPRRPSRPAINLPPAVFGLILVNVAVFVLMAALPYRWEGWVIVNLGFIPARYLPQYALDWPAIVAPLTHQFLHGGGMHILVNMIMLTAFGSGVERLLGGKRLLLMYVVCGVAGAFTHLLFYPESTTPVVGASGAISGLFGAVLRLMAKNPRAGGGLKRMVPVALIWIAIAVITGFTGLPGSGEAQVAWAAHVGGFLVGFLLFDLFAIGAWPRRVR